MGTATGEMACNTWTGRRSGAGKKKRCRLILLRVPPTARQVSFIMKKTGPGERGDPEGKTSEGKDFEGVKLGWETMQQTRSIFIWLEGEVALQRLLDMGLDRGLGEERQCSQIGASHVVAM